MATATKAAVPKVSGSAVALDKPPLAAKWSKWATREVILTGPWGLQVHKHQKEIGLEISSFAFGDMTAFWAAC